MFKKNRDAPMRVISFEYKPSFKEGAVLSGLTYASSKLWNVANYERKTWTPDIGVEYPDWIDQKTRLKYEYWYKNLPSQTAQEVLRNDKTITSHF